MSLLYCQGIKPDWMKESTPWDLKESESKESMSRLLARLSERQTPWPSKTYSAKYSTPLTRFRIAGYPLVIGHKGIPGNEEADKAAKGSAKQIWPYEKPRVRFSSAVYALDRPLLGQSRKTSWERSSKGRHLFHLTPEPTRAVCKLHAGVSKA